MSEIRFTRRPYTVTYFRDGVKHSYRRRPPQKLHDVLPTDRVELKTPKNDDWEVGETYKVKHIGWKHPNVLQLENDDGQTTFVEYFDVVLDEKVARRSNVDIQDDPEANQYLLWP